MEKCEGRDCGCCHPYEVVYRVEEAELEKRLRRERKEKRRAARKSC